MATESTPTFCGQIIPPQYRLTDEERIAQIREAERQLLDAAAQYPGEANIYRDAIDRLWNNPAAGTLGTLK